MQERKHNHYHKPVGHLKTIDPYRVCTLFGVVDPCVAHAIKKLLVAGGRGAGKSTDKDIQEAIDSLERYKEMRNEDFGPISTAKPDDVALHPRWEAATAQGVDLVGQPDKKFELDPKDITVSSYRPPGSGAWATEPDRGVKVTHIPTGIFSQCHTDRSQHRNKVNAMAQLTAAVGVHYGHN